MDSKHCIYCGENQPIDMFIKSNTSVDGYSVKCNDCFQRLRKTPDGKSQNRYERKLRRLVINELIRRHSDEYDEILHDFRRKKKPEIFTKEDFE